LTSATSPVTSSTRRGCRGGQARQPQRRRGSRIRAATRPQAAARLSSALGPIGARARADDALGIAVVPRPHAGEGVLLLWYDAFVHADDIRCDRPSVGDRDGLEGASHLAAELTKRESPRPRSSFRRPDPYDISGGGRDHRDPFQFVLVAHRLKRRRRWTST
jgi:hypothetical protein